MNLVQSILRPRDVGRAGGLVAAVRIVAGVVFVLFSFGKFIHHDAEVAALDRYGIPWPEAATALIGVLELGGGLLLVAGLLVRPLALVLAAEMAVAIATAGRIDGGAVHLGLAPALLVAMLVLVWAGAGWWSLDGRLAARGSRAPAGSAAAMR